MKKRDTAAGRSFFLLRCMSLHVRRVKQGTPNTHPIRGDELRALRRLRRDGHEMAADRREVFNVAASEAAGKLHRCYLALFALARQAILEGDLEAVTSEHCRKI